MSLIEGVIFDMDGLVLDTERLGYEAYLRSARKFGFQVNDRVHMYLAGRTEPTVVAGLHELYGDEYDVQTWRKDILAEKRKVLEEHGGRPGKKPGLLELLNYLAERGLPHALASSSSRDQVKSLLSSEHLCHAFPQMVTGDMVTRSKPDPEIFLDAAALLEASPNRCLVLEDSAVGIKAAVAGGFIPVFVFDDISAEGRVDGDIRVRIPLDNPHSAGSLARYAPRDLSGVIGIIEALES